MAINVSWTEELQTQLDKSWLILVDFWAERCGPCRMLGPVLDQLQDKYWEKITVVKVNVDDDANADISLKYSVRSIPQVTMFKWWEQVDQFIGVLPPVQIEEYITKHVA